MAPTLCFVPSAGTIMVIVGQVPSPAASSLTMPGASHSYMWNDAMSCDHLLQSTTAPTTTKLRSHSKFCSRVPDSLSAGWTTACATYAVSRHVSAPECLCAFECAHLCLTSLTLSVRLDSCRAPKISCVDRLCRADAMRSWQPI